MGHRICTTKSSRDVGGADRKDGAERCLHGAVPRDDLSHRCRREVDQSVSLRTLSQMTILRVRRPRRVSRSLSRSLRDGLTDGLHRSV